MITMLVKLEVHPHKLPDFLDAVEEQGKATFQETGCQGFQVIQGREDRHEFVLIETFSDEAALEVHRNTIHFVMWRRAVEQCVVPGSQVNTLYHHVLAHH